MLLTILPTSTAAPADLVRLFHQSQLEWSRHLGNETQLDFGRWIRNPALRNIDAANFLHDAYLLPNLSAQQLIDRMGTHCNADGVLWRGCSLNPSASPEQVTELSDALAGRGWTPRPSTILSRRYIVHGKPLTNLQMTVIPSRASYGHYHQLMTARALEQAVSDLGVPDASETCHIDRIVEADLFHLDDPHLDSLLALKAGQPVGCISVLTTGEVGTLRDWYVAPSHRNGGIGRELLDRALELCARGQLKQIMVAAPDTSAAVHHLGKNAGFAPIGTWINYRPPL